MIRLGLRWVREGTGKGVARLPVGMETWERGCQERETESHQTFSGSDKITGMWITKLPEGMDTCGRGCEERERV